MELDKAYNPKLVEEKIYKIWEKSGYFNPDNLKANQALSAGRQVKAKSYCIMIAPPNITGSLHLGHALENTISDILIRYHRMKGYKTLWLPGTDHAGIATQNVVEKELKKQGFTRHDLGKEKFLEKIWEWREKYGHIILEQLKKLGCSLDWSRTRFTMDEKYQEAVKTAFLHYQKKGLIYQGERVINWCVKDQTALSDLELEYTEEKTSLWYLKYPINENPKSHAYNDQAGEIRNLKYIIVATTRPETMLGDTAVAVNPKDERYKNFVGQTVILPIVGREIPIIADEKIDMNFGTGAVKITPAHDMADSDIAERHHLPYLKVINEIGKIINVSAEFDGLSILKAKEKIIQKFKDLGLLEKEEELIHNVAKCYRCNSTIEPLLSKQWFLKMKELAKPAIHAIQAGKIKYTPERWKEIAIDWLMNVKDWCVSRQIWWGHQLPVWFCKNQTGISNDEFLISKRDEEKFVVAAEKPKVCPFCKKCEMKQSEDSFDTWFSSALWPFATLHWPNKNAKDFQEFYPISFITSARDILHLWISRMIFSGLEFTNEAPFANVLIHGTILTKDGKRMSKSLGTGIDPLDLVEKYGADATRFGVVWQAMGTQDIHWDETAVQAGKKFANKLWNIARYILTRKTTFSDDKKEPTEDDRKIMEELKILQETTEQKITNYEFGQGLRLIYDFVWHEFADKYIETTKNREDEDAQKTLRNVLKETLKLLHPFMPFITEDIWEKMGEKNLLMIERWSIIK